MNTTISSHTVGSLGSVFIAIIILIYFWAVYMRLIQIWWNTFIVRIFGFRPIELYQAFAITVIIQILIGHPLHTGN